MTSRQRILAAARNEACDRVPVSPFGLGKLDPDGEVAARLVEVCDPFLEVSLGGHVFGGLHYVEEQIEDEEFTRLRLQTPEGALTATVKRTGVTRHTIEFFCKGPRDIEKYLSIPFEPAPVDATAFHKARRRYGEQGLVLAGCADAICLPAMLMSPADFCLLWADAPGLMVELVEEASRRVEIYVKSACEQGVDAFRIIGGEYASTQLGPLAFEQLVVEPDRRLIALMHRYGALAYYHNHGPMMRYLEPIARIGVDFLDPMEMPPYGDVDLRRARDIIGGRYCIVGTFDDMEVLEKLPLEEIKRQARQRIQQYGTRGFCLGGSASGTYGERAAEAFCALAELAQQLAS